MKRFFIATVALFAAVALQAQDALLEKYTEMGDVNTVYVSKGLLDQVPIDQFDVPGLKDVVSRIEHMTILVSRGEEAGKKMGNKLPKQLKRLGFEEKLNTMHEKQNIRILQSAKDPTCVVLVVYEKPQATVVSMKGNFEGGFEGLVPTED